MKPAQLLGVLAEQLEGRSKRRPLRVGIDGRSSAGKTTLADALADRLEARARECLRASLEDFHHPGHEQREKAGGLTPAEYLRDGYDYSKIRELLLDPLGPNGSRRCRLDFWNSHADEPFPEDWVEAKADAIVLVDGMFLHTPPLRDLWDFTIWVDVDWERMLLRGAHRDGTPGGPADLVREAHRTGWIARQRWYEESVRPQELADVVIDNSDVERPNLIRAPRPTRMVP